MRAKTYGHGVLRILFKEVLQEMPPELADQMVAGYQAGRNINLILGDSRHGKFCKTAFSIGLTDSQEWRDHESDEAA
jgi:hypothetical protein